MAVAGKHNRMFCLLFEQVAPLLLKISRCVLVLALGTAKSVMPIPERVRNVNPVFKVLAVRSVRSLLLLLLLLLLPAAAPPPPPPAVIILVFFHL